MNAAPTAVEGSTDSGWKLLFREAFRRSRNAMVLLDDRRCQVDMNGAYLQLLGYRRDALTGRPVYELVIGGPAVSDRRWRALLGQSEFSGVADLRRSDGGRVTVEVAGHPAVVDGRRLVLLVVLTTNRRGRQPDARRAANGPAMKLTNRELDVVRLIALGATGPEIAEELRVSHNTVRTHTRNAMIKLDARSRAHLVAKSLAQVLFEAEDA